MSVTVATGIFDGERSPMIFNLADYWDFCPPGDTYTVHWLGDDGIAYTIDKMSYTPRFGGCTAQEGYQRNHASGRMDWLSTWFYRDDPVRGIIEVADHVRKDTPFDRALLFWSKHKRITYAAGKEIPWGGHAEEIGTTRVWDVRVNPLPPISAFLPPFPWGWWCRAKQIVSYPAHLQTFTDGLGRTHDDVIKLQFWQPWEKWDPTDEASGGCIYYLRRGLGRIAAEWLRYDRHRQVVLRYGLASAVYSGAIDMPAPRDWRPNPD